MPPVHLCLLLRSTVTADVNGAPEVYTDQAEGRRRQAHRRQQRPAVAHASLGARPGGFELQPGKAL